jgi:hypothetical protein
MKYRIFSLLAAIGALSFFTACGGGGMTTIKTNTFTLGVSVTGLSGGSLVVQDDASQTLTFTSNASQTFSNAYASGATYSVTIKTQPAGQTCSVSGASSGTITGDLTIPVTCSSTTNPTFTVSATVVGLSSGKTLVLQDDASQQLTFTNNSTQVFSNTYTSGATYSVSILTPPSGQTCTLGSNASGTITANVTVTVTCGTAPTFTLSAAVTGLSTGATLVLQDDASQQLTFTTNSTQPFSNTYLGGATYAVTIATQPTGETCTLGTNASGTISSNITVNVTCSAIPTFTLSATVSGLSGGSVVLQDDTTAQLTFTADGTQQFSNTYISGATYSVSLVSQPTGETCALSSNSSGTITANVTVTVTCTPIPTFTLSAAVTGLSGGTLVLVDDATAQLTFTTNTTQTFSNVYLSGSGYTVAIASEPAGTTCLLGSNATGTITANTTVTVTCTPALYTISVAVTGLTGTGLVFQDNGGDNLSVPTSGTYPFATQIASGSTYNVTILTQPSGQSCSLGSNAAGTATADVTVAVTCGATTTYTITATVTGLTGTLKLEDDQSEILTFTSSSSQTFPHQYPGGSNYSVTINSQPSGQSCTLSSNASGTINANTTVTATCVTSTSSGDWTWVAGNDVVAVGGLYPPSTPPYPGSRWAGLTWTDASGNFWLFGGNGYDVNGPKINQTTLGSNEAILSDLWEYKNGAWSFKEGQAQTGQCFDFPTSTGLTGSPSARSNAVSWTDLSGNLWMFGGYENYNVPGSCNLGDAFNDWWEYTPSANTWTWVGGSSTQKASGTYNGVGNTGTPGARYWSTGYRDSNGNFWMFGGYAYDSAGTLGYINDLWKFDGTNWTWVSGSKTQGAKGIYTGTSAVPGGRAGANSWVDSSGNFWLFGGVGYDSTGNVGDMNDLWSFNFSSGKWTFVTGSKTTPVSGVYGTQGAGDSTTTPGGRFFATSWITSSGDVYLLGGQRYGFGLLNDLWKYSGGIWTWVGPTVSTPADESQFINVLGEYGTLGSANSANAPGSRQEGMAWSDASGNIWLFGGDGWGTLPVGSTQNVHSGQDSLQDLWEFQP